MTENTNEKKYEIKFARNHLTDEQMVVLQNNDLNINQIRSIRWGFMQGLSTEVMKLIGNPKYNENIMMASIDAILDESLSVYQLNIILKYIDGTNLLRFFQCKHAYMLDYNDDQVTKLLSRDLSYLQVRDILASVLCGKSFEDTYNYALNKGTI